MVLSHHMRFHQVQWVDMKPLTYCGLALDAVCCIGGSNASNSHLDAERTVSSDALGSLEAIDPA
jgi:hypothetical protein